MKQTQTTVKNLKKIITLVVIASLIIIIQSCQNNNDSSQESAKEQYDYVKNEITKYKHVWKDKGVYIRLTEYNDARQQAISYIELLDNRIIGNESDAILISYTEQLKIHLANIRTCFNQISEEDKKEARPDLY